ncbi:MAG: CHASE2 domain-containing protein [Candidatus Omnitrophica bacterium]|nr:CHASE2 domain-containing protein [Candidatus Omnitrophota bacterium]
MVVAKQFRKKSRPRSIGIWIGILASLFAILLSFTPLLEKSELTSLDLRFGLRGSQKVNPDIVIIFIEDRDIEAIGCWPWTRDYHATLIQILKECDVKAIGYDILFLDPSGHPECDNLLIQATKKARNVYHTLFFELPKFELPGEEGKVPSEERLKRFSLPAPSRSGQFYHSASASLPLRNLIDAAKGLGVINLPPDVDGISRRVPLFIRSGERLYPTLGLVVACEYLNISIESLKILPGKYVILPLSSENKIKIPIDKKGCMLINFAADIKGFSSYSFVQILQSYLQLQKGEKPLVPLSRLKGKVVLVGYVATGTVDLRPTPVSAKYPMVGLHASVVSNILKGDFLRQTKRPINFLILIFLGLLLGVAIPRVNAIKGIFLTIGIALIYFFTGFWLFKSLQIWIPFISPLIVIVLAYLAIILYRFVFESGEKRRIKSIFSRYTAPEIINKLLTAPGEVSLGGERKELTILFADIRGFTKISEGLTPEKVVEILNEVLTLMVRVIFKYRGTLDKFIGDCIMAVYGAPIPQPDHAQKAVRSALEIQEELKNIEGKWFREIGGKLEVGIAINTGEVIIGNIGSPERMDYTAIGDAVNLAARLEEIASPGEIIISENTYSLVKDLVNCQKMKSINIRGKKQPVSLYKLMELKG